VLAHKCGLMGHDYCLVRRKMIAAAVIHLNR